MTTLDYWVCPRCNVRWPVNAHGFAVTCDCADGTNLGGRTPSRWLGMYWCRNCGRFHAVKSPDIRCKPAAT